MSDSDNDSSNEGKPSSLGSNSDKKSRRASVETETDGIIVNGDNGKTKRKKKPRRRPSASNASDTETSDVEAGNSKRSDRRRRKSRSKRHTNGDDEPVIADSMLMTIKKKRQQQQAMNDDAGERRAGMSKKTSFSGSTIARDLEKKNKMIPNSRELEIAMGKMPSGHDLSDSQLMAAMGKIPQPISSIRKVDSNDSSDRSALKPSKYGIDGGNGKKIGFADEQEQVDESALTATASTKKAKLSFRPVDYGSSEDDDEIGRGFPQRSSSTSSLNDSSRLNANRNAPQSMNGHGVSRQSSWQPDRIGESRPKPRFRRAATDVDEMRSSLTAQRPGIQRRDSMGSITSSRRYSKDLLDSGENTTGEGQENRGTLIRAAKSVAQITSINQHKQRRRMEMSMQNQTYIPPKSRQTSFLQAMTHLMSGRIVDLTLWTYQASFLKVMLFFLAFYIINIFIWAAVLDAVDLSSGGKCIHEEPDGLSRSDRYEYVFELSWATFTTVGYGTISPQGDMTGCYSVRFTCAFVAFIGVLFASQTAAIMYSKLMRLLAKAHVTFSSTLCVQYGKGNEGSTVRFGQLNFRASVAPAALLKINASELLKDSGDEGSASGSEDGFPVIEFRMINDRANHEGSEIWDAQIRGIVQLHKNRDGEGGLRSSFMKDEATGGESNTLDLEKKVYYPISLSPDTHPHFSRIWYARHTLNAESPLLKREVRDLIVKDGGKWDKDFNNWEEMRDCLNEFISLRITLSGTSAVSASTVYGEHVYEFDDVCVGWRFANMVYEKKEKVYRSWLRTFGFGRSLKEDEKENPSDTADMRTKIDAALLHDIVPQPGGDHEPLNETKHTSADPGSFFLKMITFGYYC